MAEPEGATNATGHTGAAAVLEALAALRPSRRPVVLLGLGGHGAAGKTTLADALPDAQVVATDAFWDGERFALDRLRGDVIEPLLAGLPASYDAFSWAAGRPEESTRSVVPEGLVVVEGVCALHRDLRDAYDLRVWLDTPLPVRLARIEARDGAAAAAHYESRWLPSETRYVERDDPVAAAHLVIRGA